MGLRIDAELREKYIDFYSIAFLREEYENALVLQGLTNESAKSLTDKDKSACLLVIKKSPYLTDLSFLADFKNLQHISIFDCKRITALWDFTKCESLVGIALTGCKGLCSLNELSVCTNLTNLLIDYGVLCRTKPESLVPLTHCKKLKTLDLAFIGVKDKRIRIDYNSAWPALDSFTVSAKIRKYFISLKR